MKTILLTGCAGFIGSNFLKRICANEAMAKDHKFVVLDALTYAGHYPNIEADINKWEHLTFVKGDLRNADRMALLFAEYDFDGVINFAAESHVDRSIENPNIFVETNILGTLNLLNNALSVFQKKGNFRFLQVSTDEVYGDLTEDQPAFTEENHITPSSPYSSSKAGADLLVKSYFETFKLPILITRCSNNYGPFQFPEKLIPLMIDCALQDKSLPVYGDGKNIRDWIHVDDHNDGVWAVFEKGRPGEVYNLGGDSEKRNIEIVQLILEVLEKPQDLIKFVTDRLGHDWRYAMDFSKIKKELGWSPKVEFSEGLQQTVKWYLDNQDWVKEVQATH